MKRIKKTVSAVIASVLTLLAAASWATIQPNPLFSDGVVLQRDMSVPVWGTASDGERVTVTIQNQSVSTEASGGKWIVRLNPLREGGPYTIKINDLTIENVMVGEVWICSGQSNMEMSLQSVANASEAIAASKDPMLRLFHVRRTISKTPLYSASGLSWQESAPESTPDFSAVGYFFAKELRKSLDVPVGIIESAWGGTDAESWTSRDALLGNPDFHPILVESDTAPFNGEPNHACLTYNGMIAPLQPYAMRGVIWYQGENNASRAMQYRTLFPTLIGSWRKAWGQGNFPFYFVQLAPFGSTAEESQMSTWAELREAQLLTSKNCQGTAMAVITDVGDRTDIHPRQKEPVGYRLALAAEALTYSKHVVYNGPIYKSMSVKSGKAIVLFDNTSGGLVAKDGELKGFTIAGENGKFYNAEARIVGNNVEVMSPEVPKPVAVRYGWADCPVVNLFNGFGLPASPFRTDCPK
ncbi:MAG: sialate O-acetylesterase [Armatimonadota bacterium]|nr:sialate O-acetylesterase [bacterium]